MRTERRAALAAALILVVVAGCGGGTAATASPASSSAASPAASETASQPAESASASPSGGGSGVDVAAACPSPEADKASTTVDTAKFKKDSPWTLGVSAGYLSNAWIAFNNAEVKYAASKDDRFGDVVVTDAGFDVAKQVADIEDLITRKVSGIIYWPIDNGALQAVLQKAEDAGIPTVNVANGFSDQAGITSNAQIDNYVLARESAAHLAEDLGGTGKIVGVIPIQGTTAATAQKAALDCVLGQYPNIELLDVGNGDWDTAKSKTITEAWLQRFPQIDGVFSPSGQMSLGVAEAFDEAGRLDEVTFSPGDEYNGWLKWISAHQEKNKGIVSFPVAIGARSVELMAKILSGEQVPLGIWTGAEYVAPEAAAAMAVADKADDWWPNDLPAEFLPSK